MSKLAVPQSAVDMSNLDIHINLPGLKLGILEATHIRSAPSEAALAQEINQKCDDLRRLHSFENIGQWEPVRAARKMFRQWGLDPCRYRPSSEALLRRIVKGEAFPRISNIVDIGNLGAIETGWPYGCYDRTRVRGPVQIRHGRPGEQYDGIGRHLLRLEGRPLFSDVQGPFGSPVSDSTRTMVTGGTHELLVIICVPENGCSLLLEETLARLAVRVALWCDARGISTRIVDPEPAGHRCSSKTCLPYSEGSKIARERKQDLQNLAGGISA